MCRMLGDGSQLVLIAGSAPGEGGGSRVLAANLAVALAERTGEVILVCPDGSAAQKFWPLTELPDADSEAMDGFLAGRADIGDIAGPVPQSPGLSVLVPGRTLNLSPQSTLQNLASRLRSSARYVVVDASAPGAGPGSDLAEFCDAAVLAAELPGTRSTDVERCLWRLDRLGTRVLGLVAMPRLRWPARSPQRRTGSPSARPGRRGPDSDAADDAVEANSVIDETPASRDWEEPEPADDGHTDLPLSSRAKTDAMDSVSEK
jgi:Mrp family chromosome partitioning ATPase